MDNSLVVKYLKAEYKRRSQLRPLLWESTIQLPLEKVYTSLKIVSRPKAGIQSDDDDVNVYDIFKALNKGEDAMMLVEGSPGIGKTTFCLKLAYDWATKFSFPNFEFFLLLKCRDIDGDIMEAISEQLLPEDIEEKTKEQLMNFIKDIHNQERVLIILDGLDELPQKSQHHVDKLLHRRILPFCYVLATSRQEKGIEVRRKFDFDIQLQIKGFTESNSFEYIRKHFENVGTGHSSKGERLIGEIKENPFLHALRSNPLNLLLLCVIYEDYEGKLPSSRADLYQVIVRCLLRRYCAKHNLEAKEDDEALEKQFKKDILALGKLAWKCLLDDRHCFREEKLTELEIRNKNLVARELGILYKEESLKRLKPQHEYYFLHKSFQEYLAAWYIARKLRKNQFDVFEHLDFDDLVKKYPQVFRFVCGILGEEASILFGQIGKKLQSSGGWDWLKCSEAAATFFIESFSESGNAEVMAVTLCSFIPFPLHLEIDMYVPYDKPKVFPRGFMNFFKACNNFELQKPVTLIIRFGEGYNAHERVHMINFVQYCPHLTTLSITDSYEMTTKVADALFNVLSASTSLLSFTLKVLPGISCEVPAVIGKGLAAVKSLTTVAFELPGCCSEAWVNALETGLSADTPLASVVLKLCSMSDTAIKPVEKLFSKKSLSSLSLVILGDLQDLLAASVGKGLAGQTFLKTLNIRVEGKLSFSGANFLKGGLLENRSLNDLKLFAHGEVPENWEAVVENLHFTKKWHVSPAFHPNTCSKVTENQMAHFRPVVVENGLVPEQHLTANIWGELTCEGAAALCEVLTCSTLSSLTLNVHGKLTENTTICIARHLELHKTLSSLTVNIWGELITKVNTVLHRLSKNNLTVTINVPKVPMVSDESCNGHDISIDNPTSLTTLFTKVKDTGNDELCLTVNINNDVDWTQCLRDCLAENTSLNALALTIKDNSDTLGDWGYGLGEVLAENTSLNALTLTMKDNSDTLGDWGYGLGEGLAENTSLNALTLTINNYSGMIREWGHGLGDGLAENTSLNALTLTINNYSDMTNECRYVLTHGLAKNTSLNALTLTINEYGDMSGKSGYGLYDGLAKNTSLNALTLTINYYGGMSREWGYGLGDGLAQNTSLNALTLTIHNYGDMSDEWGYGLGYGLAKNTSLNALTLAINNYGDMSGDWTSHLGEGLSKNKSLTSFNLTVNTGAEVSEDWLPFLCGILETSETLTAVRITVNVQHITTGRHAYDFSKLVVKCRSLALLDLNVSFYGMEDSS